MHVSNKEEIIDDEWTHATRDMKYLILKTTGPKTYHLNPMPETLILKPRTQPQAPNPSTPKPLAFTTRPQTLNPKTHPLPQKS